MARRGAFGRSPRPAASLTNTIVSIAREMQNQRDQNIINAWQQGGLFEGKKVTDEMVLAYWTKRASQVDKKDPMYDAYHDALLEYDYSINESKMRTGYAQGKISDNAAASFYLNWSKKIPKNSEFWRVLQRDAAQFTSAAKAKSTAAAKQAAEDAYQANRANIYDTKIKAGDYILDVFKNLAQRGGHSGDPLIDPLNGELYQLQPDSVPTLLNMISGASDQTSAGQQMGAGAHKTTGAAANASDKVLYHDPLTGKPVTGQSIVAALRAIDPKFDGNLSLDALQTFIASKKAGLQDQARIADKTGHVTDASNARKDLMVVAEVGREIKAWPVEQNYLTARQAMMDVLDRKGASAQDIKEAIDIYRNQLRNFANDPSIATNDVFRNKLLGEADGTPGASAAEDFTGLGNPSQADISKEVNSYELAVNQMDAVANGLAVWTTGEWKDGAFHPSAGGSAIGAAPTQDILNNSGGIPARTMYVQDNGGRFLPVQVMGQNVTAHAFDPVTGEALSPAGSPVVGHIYELPDGSRVYQFRDSNGHDQFSSSNPWGSGNTLTESGTGFDLTIPSPTGDLANTGFRVVASSANKTKVVFDPTVAAMSSSTDGRAHLQTLSGGGDPHTDFSSPNIALYSDGDPNRRATLLSLQNNPAFMAQVNDDNNRATGAQPQYDDKGNFLGYVGGDQAALARASAQSAAQVNPATQPWQLAENLWNRSTPASALPVDERGVVQDSTAITDPSLAYLNQGQYQVTPTFKPLASTQLADNGIPLGRAFEKGTLNMAPPTPATDPFHTIGLSEVKIKTPVIPQVSQQGPTFPGSTAYNLNPAMPSASLNPTLPPTTVQTSPNGRNRAL